MYETFILSFTKRIKMNAAHSSKQSAVTLQKKGIKVDPLFYLDANKSQSISTVSIQD